LSVFMFGVRDTVDRQQSAYLPAYLCVCVPACLRACVPAVSDSIAVLCALGPLVSLRDFGCVNINPLNAELNPICHLLALLADHHILHISRIRVKEVTLFYRQETLCKETFKKYL